MTSHANIMNEAYRAVMRTTGQFGKMDDRIAAYAKLVKLYSGFLFADYYPVLLGRGFEHMSKRPHVPHKEDLPELTDFEWSRMKRDLAHNIEMAQQAQFENEEDDVS